MTLRKEDYSHGYDSPRCPDKPRRDQVHTSCPQCGSEMVDRRNGFTGEIFLGCTRFPRCRGTRSYKPSEQKEAAERYRRKFKSVIKGIGVAAVIFDHLGRVVVGERISPNILTLPGGEVEEKDEDTGFSSVRETFEECGLVVEPISILFDTFNIENKGKKWVTLYWLMKYVSGELEAKEPDKYRSWAWMDLDSLSDTIWIPAKRIRQESNWAFRE